MKRWLGVGLVFWFFWGVGVAYANGGVGWIRYELIDPGEHLFHMTAVFEKKVRSGVLSEVKFRSTSLMTKIENPSAFDVEEKTDLKVEKGMVEGYPSFRLYISPGEPTAEEDLKHKIAVASGEAEPGEVMMTVTVRVEADYRDDELFIENVVKGRRILSFCREVSYKRIEVCLPEGYALTKSMSPISVFYKVGKSRCLWIQNDEGKVIRVDIEAVKLEEG